MENHWWILAEDMDVKLSLDNKNTAWQRKVFVSDFPSTTKHLELSWHSDLPYGVMCDLC